MRIAHVCLPSTGRSNESFDNHPELSSTSATVFNRKNGFIISPDRRLVELLHKVRQSGSGRCDVAGEHDEASLRRIACQTCEGLIGDSLR